MFEGLHLEELEGTSIFEVIGKLLARIPGMDGAVQAFERCSIVLLILCVILALLQCFAGYKLRRLWTTEVGLAVSGIAGAAVAVCYELPGILVVCIAAVAALLGALVSYFLWKLLVVVRTLVAVAVLIFAIFTVYQLPEIGLIAGVATGLIAGILVLAYQKNASLICTSLLGGLTATACFAETGRLALDGWIVLIAGIALSLIGMLVQFLTNRQLKGEPVAIAEEQEVKEQNSSEESLTEGMFRAEAATAEEMTGEAKETDAQKGAAEEAKAVGSLLCPDCGAEYKENAKFCIKCGHKLVS